MNLHHRVIVITGASSGIGHHLAVTLAAQGAKVAAIARREDRLADLITGIENGGGTAKAYPLDVSDLEAFRSTLAAIEKDLGPVDILINNAGYGRWSALADESIDDIEGVMRVNYFGVIYGMKLVLPGMLERQSGHIINVASIAGEYASPNLGPYCATKAAVIAVSQSAEAELQGTGVRISVVNPGPVKTEFHDGESWQERKRHTDTITASVEDVTQTVLRVIEKGTFKTYVYWWWGVLLWGFHALGPLGRLVVQAKRRLKLHW